ncbi:MAG: rcc01693 family protein [Afipia sp.]|nr:rcc01693 family protein [Afipia sp.]
MKPFPWSEAIGFGIGVLRLPPDQFWRMTPRELAYAVAAVRGPNGEPINRTSLDRLMQRFPDKLRGA